MVEVLVALVILSIGLLAVAGMQTTSLKGGNNALYRTQAVFAAEDIMDRIRANRGTDGANVSLYEIGLGDPDPASWTTLAELENELVSSYGDMVLTDLVEWKFYLSNSLPSGDGSVDVDGLVITVSVRWEDSFGQEEIEMVTRL